MKAPALHFSLAAKAANRIAHSHTALEKYLEGCH
jgi:hypothetical protein